MVQHGAGWCKYFKLRSEFVAELLLKKSEQQMSNKTDAKHQKSRKMTVELKTQKTLDWQGFQLSFVMDCYRCLSAFIYRYKTY
jgi:hypothetical protein